MVDDGDLLRRALGLFHIMRGKEDRQSAFLVQFFDIRPDIIARLRIEACRRLVQKQDRRRVQQPASDLEAPLHAAGKRLDQVVLAVPQLDELHQVLDFGRRFSARHSIEPRVKEHVLVRRQLVVERRVLKDDAERLPHVMRPLPDPCRS